MRIVLTALILAMTMAACEKTEYPPDDQQTEIEKNDGAIKKVACNCENPAYTVTSRENTMPSSEVAATVIYERDDQDLLRPVVLSSEELRRMRNADNVMRAMVDRYFRDRPGDRLMLGEKDHEIGYDFMMRPNDDGKTFTVQIEPNWGQKRYEPTMRPVQPEASDGYRPVGYVPYRATPTL